MVSSISDYSFPGDDVPSATNVDTIVYTDGRGETVDLSTIMDEQYKEGMDGRFMAPVEHYSDQVPEQDGARYRGSRVVPNLLSIPIDVVADDIGTLRSKVRVMAAALHPKRGMGLLTVGTADGLTRYANCVLESGIEKDPATDGEEYDAKVILNFRAFDPFWYDSDPVAREWSITTSPGTFFPGPPWRLGPSTVFSIFTETNEGDVEAWPVWTLTGPGHDVVLSNATTGESLSCDFAIAAGETITIDTRPGEKSIYTQDGTNLFGLIDGTLWSLADGSNDVMVQMLGTTGATAIHLAYQARFHGV